MDDLNINDIIDGPYSDRVPPYSFEDDEKKRYNDKLIGSRYLNGDKGNVKYHPNFRLWNENNNIFRPSLEKAITYFRENGIKWFKIEGWSENGSCPTKHVLSSQIACLNHLFPIRGDRDAVLAVAKAIDPDISDVVILDNDTKDTRGYISFEVVSDRDYLNENVKQLSRGEFCTSVDALIIGIRNGKRVMLVIEWKYTESYGDKDYSIEDRPYESKGSMGKGLERLRRYSRLICDSSEIIHPATDNLQRSIFFFEPFYQLMRQTLWAEQIILHNETETLKADDFIHIHIIPSANHELLDKVYPVSGKRMEDTWREQITHQDKYKIIRPDELLDGVNREKYKELFDYLDNRYWKGDNH